MRRQTCLIRRPSPLLLAAFALAACAGPSRQQDVAYAQQALVGMPVGTLLSCAGVPDRTAQVQGTEYLTYVSRESRGFHGPTSSFGLSTGSGGTGVGIGIGIPLLGNRSAGACEATFVVDQGAVRGLQYAAGSEPRQCYRIVENCLAGIPGAPAP